MSYICFVIAWIFFMVVVMFTHDMISDIKERIATVEVKMEFVEFKK
jgi:hypothetical protein